MVGVRGSIGIDGTEGSKGVKGQPEKRGNFGLIGKVGLSGDTGKSGDDRAPRPRRTMEHQGMAGRKGARGNFVLFFSEKDLIDGNFLLRDENTRKKHDYTVSKCIKIRAIDYSSFL